MVAVFMSLLTLMIMNSFYYYFNSWMMIDYLVLVFFATIFMHPVDESVELLGGGLMMDGLSLVMVLLVFFLFMVMYLASGSVLNNKVSVKNYNMFIMLLSLSLLFSFMVDDYIWFYILFEISLIPTLFLIVGWGYQPERLQAGVYLMVYTLLGSLPLLFSLVYFISQDLGLGMLDPLLLVYSQYTSSFFGVMVSIFLVMAFLVKLPMYLFHLWLPKAHVEAPVAGSMILAGVLLKLGGYGLIRIFVKFLSLVSSLSHLLVALSLVGMVVIGLVCCRLNDLKLLVAYSSILHMGLVICGILSSTLWGINGALMMMVSHGIGSSGLFGLVNILYERTGTRSLLMNSGLINIMPLLSLFMFFFMVISVSGPPSFNLLAEINLIIGLVIYEKSSMVLFALGSFLGAASMFYMFSLSQHGKSYFGVTGVTPVYSLEYHVILVHLIPINLLILKNDLFFFYC